MATKTKLRILGILLGIVVISLVVSYNQQPKTAITIGVIAPLTGLGSGEDNVGNTFVNGVILAHEEYMKSNPDNPVQIIVEDDEYNSRKGLSAFQKLVSIDKIDGLVNLSSPTIDVIKDELSKSQLPVLQLGAETDVTADTIFQIYPDQTAVRLLALEANKNGVQDITVVMEQVKAYERFISDFESEFKGRMHIVRVPGTEKDFRSTALQVKELNSPALLMFSSAKIGGNVLSRLVDLNVIPKQLYFDLALQFAMDEYKTILGKKISVLENAVILYSVAKTGEEFKQKYKERFNRELGFLSGYGYDAFNVILAAYDEDREEWVENIQTYTGSGATGEISFSDIGLRPPEFVIGTVINGMPTSTTR